MNELDRVVINSDVDRLSDTMSPSKDTNPHHCGPLGASAICSGQPDLSLVFKACLRDEMHIIKDHLSPQKVPKRLLVTVHMIQQPVFTRVKS